MRPGLSKWGITLVGLCENGGSYQMWLFHRRYPLRTLRTIPFTIRQARALEDRNELL